jgi:hypothetical protein
MARNTNPGKSKSARAQQTPREPIQERLDTEPDQNSLAEAARQLEWEKLREKRLKVDREESRLVPIAEVNAFVAGMIIKARDELVRIGQEEASALAQEMDPMKCEAIVSGRIFSVLEKLTEYRQAA